MITKDKLEQLTAVMAKRIRDGKFGKDTSSAILILQSLDKQEVAYEEETDS